MSRQQRAAINTTAFIVALAVACSPFSSGTASPSTPTRPTNIFNLTMITPGAGWANAFQPRTNDSAERSLLVRTTDGGSHWRDVSPPGVKPSGATPMEFLDQNIAWIMAFKAPGNIQVLRTNDAGAHWKETIIPDPKMLGQLSNTGSAQIRFVDALYGWLFVSYGHDARESGALYRTVDGGDNWSLVSQADRSKGTASAIPLEGYKTGFTFIDRTNGWLTIPTYGPKPLLYATHDAGVSWSAVQYPSMPGIRMGPWQAVSRPRFFSKAAGEFEVLSDHSVVFATTDGGATWRPGVTGPCLEFSFIDVNTGWALCHQDSTNFTDLLATSDAGQHWRVVHSKLNRQTQDEVAQNFQTDVRGPYFVNSLIGFILRSSGQSALLANSSSAPAARWTQKLLKTTDGGATWNEVRYAVS